MNFTKFLRVYNLQNTYGRLPLCFVFFSEILVKKAFWMILQYFRNSSCKLTLQIVRLSQSLSAYYLKIPKLLQCHRQPGAFRKIFVPSVNDHPAIVNIIPQILWKRPPYPDYFFSCDYAATEDSKWEDPLVYLIEQISITEDAVKHCEGLKA